MLDGAPSVSLPASTAPVVPGAVVRSEKTAPAARTVAAPVIPGTAQDPKAAKLSDDLARSTVLNQNKGQSRTAAFKAEVKEGWQEGGPLGIVGGALNGAGKALIKNNNPGKEPGKMGLFGLLKAVTAGVFIAAGTLINVGGIFTKNTYNEVKNFFSKRINGPDHETAEKEYEVAKADYDELNKRYNDSKPDIVPKEPEKMTGNSPAATRDDVPKSQQTSAKDLEKLEQELEEARKRMDRAKRRMDRANETPAKDPA